MTRTVRSAFRDRVRTATRDALLTAAEQVFAERGTDGARIEDIASRAGVAVGTLYNYFSDARDMLHALIDERGQNLIAQLDEAVPRARRGTCDWSDEVDAFIRVVIDFIRDHHPFYAILMQCEHRKGPTSGRRLSDEFYGRAEALVKRGVRAGAIRTADAVMLPSLLVSVCRSPLVHLGHAGAGAGASWTTDMSEQIVRFFWGGVGGKAARERRRG